MKLYICAWFFFFSFLISLPLPLSVIKGRNTPGKPVREVSEIQAHSHGFCLSHPAFCVWRLCKNCERARACLYYTCHHVRMVVTSPLAASWGTVLNYPLPLSSPWRQDDGLGDAGVSLKWKPFIAPGLEPSVATCNANETNLSLDTIAESLRPLSSIFCQCIWFVFWDDLVLGCFLFSGSLCSSFPTWLVFFEHFLCAQHCSKYLPPFSLCNHGKRMR